MSKPQKNPSSSSRPSPPGFSEEIELRLGQQTNWIATVALCLIATVALGVALIYTQKIMIPFVVSIFVVTLVSPILDFQVLRLRLPRTLAVCTTLLIVVAVIALIGIIVTQALSEIITTTARYSDDFATLARQLIERVRQWGFDVKQAEIIPELQKKIPTFVSTSFGSVLGVISNVTLITIFIIFLLAGRNPHIVHKGVYAEIDKQIRKYIAVKLILSAATGLLVWFSLSLFGLEMAAVFGTLAFLLNFIPSVGSIIATLLPIPVAVAQFDSLWSIVGVIAVPGMIQMVIGNGIDPKVLGRELNLHPVTVLLALSFWGLMWGIVGMFLSVPITAALRIILMQFELFRPVADLMAGELPQPHENGNHSSSL